MRRQEVVPIVTRWTVATSEPCALVREVQTFFAGELRAIREASRARLRAIVEGRNRSAGKGECSA